MFWESQPLLASPTKKNGKSKSDVKRSRFSPEGLFKKNPGDFQSESQVVEKVQEFQNVSLTPIHISSTGFSSIKPDIPSKTVNRLSATFAG